MIKRDHPPSSTSLSSVILILFCARGSKIQAPRQT
jgi:hypothetical protein